MWPDDACQSFRVAHTDSIVRNFSLFRARIDRNSTELNCNGTRVTVTADQLRSLEKIGGGQYGSVFHLEIERPVRMSMAVKVSRSISRRAEIEMFEVSLQRIPIGGKPNDRQAMYAELTALEKIRSTPSPYVVDFYGALIDSVKVFSRFSSRSCDRFSFDIQNELYIFMAYMTTNVEMFYQTMHGTARNSSEDIDQFVRRCAHDVSSRSSFE